MNSLNLRAWHRYYSPIIACEFAASAHASYSMTTNAYQSELAVWEDVIRGAAAEVVTYRTRYTQGDCGLYEVAATAMHCSWVSLMELAKAVGCRLGNETIYSERLPSLPTPSPATVIIDDFTSHLTTAWSDYPAWNDLPYPDWLFEVWRHLTYAYGYRFEEQGDACGVRFL